jgi:Ca-activated chloride channel homolog
MPRVKRVGASLKLPLSLLIAGLAAASAQDRISVDVNLVVLHATVTDRKGLPVSGLGEQNFQIYDEGAPRELKFFSHEDIPVTVGLVVDHSGSMRHKLSDLIAAAETFARASNPADQIFVVNFNEHVVLASSELQRAIAETPATGKTALYDAVVAGLRQIRTGARDKKVLIVISDGGDNASRVTRAEAMKAAKDSDAIIYTIGLFDDDDPDRNPRVLEELARATGGQAFLPETPAAVVGICKEIAADVRSQYTLGFAPPPSAGSGWRTIRVTASAPHRGRLTVRTRAGYYPPAVHGAP